MFTAYGEGVARVGLAASDRDGALVFLSPAFGSVRDFAITKLLRPEHMIQGSQS